MSATTVPCKKKLENKVAIITGGASGIGEATALLFADHGAHAVVIADIQDEKGRKLAESIGTHICTYIHCDVSDEHQIKSLVESTVRLYGRLDVMFCNAGIISLSQQTVLDFDVADYEKLFSVNVGGAALGVKHGARAMVDGGVKGSIVCTASVVASMGSDVFTDYAMSKHAVLGLVRSASKQLGAYGIRVNCVSPGPVATPMLCDKYGVEADGVEKAFELSSSLKGILKANHVAQAVLFLACEDSEFITGHNLTVDGGFKTTVHQQVHRKANS